MPVTDSAASRGMLLLLVVALSWTSTDAVAQPVDDTAPARLVQVGPAALPGLGVQAVYVQPRSFYTLESAFYSNLSPQFMEGEGSLLLSGGVGAAVRILGALTTLDLSNYEGYQLDLGFRFGPALRLKLDEETRSEKNKRARLFLEPFGRFAWTRERQTFFAELGTQRPFLRAGLWLTL